MNTVVLEAKKLTKSYAQRRSYFSKPVRHVALQDVSLSLQAGETLAVVGESGSGKSTLARSLLQLHPVDAGEVWLEGRNLAKLEPQELRATRRKLQMIFQDPFASLNPRMRVVDIIAEGLRIHHLGTPAQQIEQVVQFMKRVGLHEQDMWKYPHEFSGGQRQRIGIARALILEPSVVVCDEPVSALDVSIQAQILLLLKTLQKEMGLSYVFISHDLRVVRHIAHRVAVLHCGRIIEEAKVDILYNHPQTDYTRQLLDAIPGKTNRR